jgi:O-antigen/teichoic acid export membrane protein
MKSLPRSWKPSIPSKNLCHDLLKFGGWVTLTNILGSLMSLGYIDRFILGSIRDMAAVAYYATPFELLSKLLILSGALVTALFPVFSIYSLQRSEQLHELHERAIRFLLPTMTILCGVVIICARPFLQVWLGSDFAQESALPLQLLSVGVVFGAVGIMPMGALQAIGRPDLTAKRHAIELPLYTIAAWLCISRWGIIGAAAVWSCYMLVDTVVLYWLLRTILIRSNTRLQTSQPLLLSTFAAAFLGAAFLITIMPFLLWQLIGAVVFILTGTFVAWRYALTAEDHVTIHKFSFFFRPRSLAASEATG